MHMLRLAPDRVIWVMLCSGLIQSLQWIMCINNDVFFLIKIMNWICLSSDSPQDIQGFDCTIRVFQLSSVDYYQRFRSMMLIHLTCWTCELQHACSCNCMLKETYSCMLKETYSCTLKEAYSCMLKEVVSHISPITLILYTVVSTCKDLQ